VPDLYKGDLFSYKLDYEAAGQWNGNIGRQSWNHVQGTEAVGVRNYQYTFDATDRLKAATFTGLTGENYSISNVNYDKNGNITQLQRNGKVTVSTYGAIDNLTYTYNGNRLTSVSDAVTENDNTGDFRDVAGNTDYTYYENGALKSDANKGVSLVEHNTYLNKISKVTYGNGDWIAFTYDGSGTLIKRENSNGDYWEYVDKYIFKNGLPYSISIPEGRASFEEVQWKYEFEFRDVWNNLRVVFGADGNRLVKKQQSDYDVFGMELFGLGMESTPENLFKFQGKEKIKELGWHNFGARMYSPEIGRFMSIDPLAEHPNQLGISPYAFANNNPVNMIDPDGRIPYPITVRAFAPFKTFGRGFHGDGLNRGYTTSSSATARVHQRLNFDTDKTSMTTTAWSSPTSHILVPGSYTETPTVKFDGGFRISSNGDAKTFRFGTHVAGANPMIPKAPDIDVFSDFSITENKKAGFLNISGSLKGDNFPSTEAFITDPIGNNVFIGIGHYEGSPFSSLDGTNKRDITSFNFSITTDKKGNFTGVKMGDTSYSLDDWNKRFTSSDPHKK
jgi:RHS repeat-associated protein